MSYHGKVPAPIEDTLTFPTVDEPVKLIGPSSLAILKGKLGEQYTASLWVGGLGLAVDQRWGENFQWCFTVPYDAGIPNIPMHAGMMLAKYRSQIHRLYGEEVGEAVMHAITKVLAGHFYRRPHTAAEIMENA